MTRRILHLALLLGFAASAGCSRTVTIREWQRSVESYSAVGGGHNLNRLRDVRAEDGRHQFAVLGSADANKSTDVVGVLVGLAPVDRQPWFIFLVGTIDSCDLKESRAAALSETDGKFRWALGPPQPQATAAYTSRFGSERASPFRAFPAEGAAFDLEHVDREVVVIERATGARWTVQVEPATAAPIVATDQ